MDPDLEGPEDHRYAKAVGERLRSIRRQKAMSLQESELASNQEFKASVLGAYERGERAISVPRLQRLARFYSVPVDQLLPQENDGTDVPSGGMGSLGKVTIDLTRLNDQPDSTTAQMLGRFLRSIQVQRQDFNGKMLTIRRDDLRAIACILDTSIEDVADELDAMGLSLNR